MNSLNLIIIALYTLVKEKCAKLLKLFAHFYKANCMILDNE